ncbi:uncharacterized protein BDR25DRAFT_304746 [Lindgomyces ingoldianus]|uniref:Uncharacterized protein n=1 Tax=Lindgomyces ingoldianus TaxID=673940 RepID=A0ACB6QQB0_9PLEO|nr:uncharacterized protein BDR25DRAFT_304746 [Lindgomyces ingoldianus]KAF2468758.1 hypothetical protein BDR25DRAFT_304746 [Lindgomyces ingoldianus]
MRSAAELLFFALGLFEYTSASSSSSPSFSNAVTWIQYGQSAVVKLDTPGYPLWLMDKANAPILHEQAGDSYWPQDKPSAVLLNLTMSLDNKTLLLNHNPILPLSDPNVPPLIEAYQVPADMTTTQIRGLVSNGLLNRQWEGLTLGWRYLALDYDRLVWADPETGPYQNHVPILRFRIMGIGAHSRNDVLDVEKQQVVHVTLQDWKHGSSDAKDRSYGITKIELVDVEESYAYVPAMEPEQEECSLRSWRCADKGLYQEGPPWYRFIWRERFDWYGRVGSLRHAVVRKVDVMRKFVADAGPAMVFAFVILFGAAILVMSMVGTIGSLCNRREKTIRELAEDDRFLGEEADEERYLDDEEEKEVVPSPLPPRSGQDKEEAVLIDLGC